jgi:curved DNA-binding protein CbpA
MRLRAPEERQGTPYEVLGVAETASTAEIRAAYLSKIRQFPPEREPEGFKSVQKAYSVLKDAARRKALDLSVFRRSLLPNPAPVAAPDFGALFRNRVFLLLLASSDLYVDDFARYYGKVESKMESLS